MNATFKTVMLWMSLMVVVFLAWHFAQFQKKETPVKFSEFMTQAEAGQVADVTITGNEIKGHTASREAFRTFAPLGYDKLTDRLLAKNVVVTYQPDTTPTWANMLISWAPFLLLMWLMASATRGAERQRFQALGLGMLAMILEMFAEPNLTAPVLWFHLGLCQAALLVHCTWRYPRPLFPCVGRGSGECVTGNRHDVPLHEFGR